VTIVDSGAEEVTEPFSVSKEDATEWNAMHNSQDYLCLLPSIILPWRHFGFCHLNMQKWSDYEFTVTAVVSIMQISWNCAAYDKLEVCTYRSDMEAFRNIVLCKNVNIVYDICIIFLVYINSLFLSFVMLVTCKK
jgi:hypothetical protein